MPDYQIFPLYMVVFPWHHFHYGTYSGGFFCLFVVFLDPVGKGGSRELAQTLLLAILYTIQLYILSALPFVSGPLALLPLKITAVQTSLVAAMYPIMDNIVHVGG